MKKYVVSILILVLAYACSNNTTSSGAGGSASGSASDAKSAEYDSIRGSGKFTHVDLGAIDAKMVEAGKNIYDLKCSACHKLTSEKLVGPGWLGVTNRHKPEWILNFVTNTDEMIDKDPKAQAMLQVCMVRMPNQHLSDDDARHILEFMRNNDQSK